MALIITVIILLILAGITFTALVGNNNILKRAGDASEKMIIEDEKEAMTIAYSACKIENVGKKITDEQLQNEMTANGRNVEVSFNDDDLEVLYNKTKHKYIINQKGDIEQVKYMTPEEASEITNFIYVNSEVYVAVAGGEVRKGIVKKNGTDKFEVEMGNEVLTKNGVKAQGTRYFIDKKGKVWWWSQSDTRPICMSDLDGSALKGRNVVRVVMNTTYWDRYIALDDEGLLYFWGNNTMGQSGLSDSSLYIDVPICISKLNGCVMNNVKIVDFYVSHYMVKAIDDKRKFIFLG